MRKILFTLMIVALLACPAMAQRYRQQQVFIVDEFGDAVTNITQISIFDSGTSSATTLYADRAGQISMTNPITTGSTASLFDQSAGLVTWYQSAPDYKITLTDGTKVLTIDAQNASDTRFPWYANFIGTAASLSVDDNESISVGTENDAVLSWVNATSILQWLPAADASIFNIGSTTVAKQFDFHVYVGGIGGGGLTIDEGTPSFAWTGGTATIDGGPVSINNDSATNITNIGTGSTTGAINIGSATSGIVTIDGTSSGTFSVDNDLTLASTASSIIISAAEAVADGITIDSAGGGLDLSAVDNIDMVLTAAAGGDDFKITVAGGQDASIHLLSDGTGADAISLITSAGGIDLTVAGAAAGEDIDLASNTAINLASSEAADLAINISTSNAAGQIQITSADTTTDGIEVDAAGGIDIDAADDITIDIAGAAGQDYMVTNTGGSVIFTTTEADVADAMTFKASNRGIIDVQGALNPNVAYCLFEDEPILQSYGEDTVLTYGGVPVGETGEENVMMFPNASFFYHIIGAGQTILGPVLTAAGLDIAMDLVADEGVEICPNILGRAATGGSRQAFIIDTDAFYLKAKIYITDTDGTDDLFVGFRKVEAFNGAINAYTDYAGLNNLGGDIYIETALNDAGDASDDTTDDWADTTAVELGIFVDITGAVTYTIDGSAPSATQAFTFDTTDVVVPCIFFLHHTNLAEATYLQSWECGLQY